MSAWWTPRRVAAGLLVVGVVLGTSAGSARPGSGTGEVVVAAVGDMACAPDTTAEDDADNAPTNGRPVGTKACREGAVSDTIIASRPVALLALGDIQYERGAPGDWGPYDGSYGRLRDITWPVPGNHEYLTPGAEGYYAYFGARAGARERGYYSFDLAGWHLIALNSQCRQVGGCGDRSPQTTWLIDDLRRHPARCTLAYWHIPRFSSGRHGDQTAYRAWWRVLAEHGVDLVLAGHDHNYERLAALDAEGAPSAHGLPSFVVGTGGRNLRAANAPRLGSERLIADAFGFLELRLRADSYGWRFRSIDRGVLDEGASRCR